MTRGIIAHTYTVRRSVLTLALLTVLTAACMANSASAATESKIGSERSPGQLANDGSSSAAVFTLTSNNGQPRSSAEGQLPLGIALLAVGVLGLLYGVAASLKTSSPSPARTP